MTLMFLFFLLAAGFGFAFRLFLKPWIMGKPGMPAASSHFGLPIDLDGMLVQMERIIRARQAQGQGNQAPVDPRFSALMADYNNALLRIDTSHRQRYEARVGEIQGMAAQLGWSINTPSW